MYTFVLMFLLLFFMNMLNLTAKVHQQCQKDNQLIKTSKNLRWFWDVVDAYGLFYIGSVLRC